MRAQASDSFVDAFDCEHDAPEAWRVWRRHRGFNLNEFWIAKLRQLKPPVSIRGPHHNDVDFDIFDPIDTIHPRALDLRLAIKRHAERREKRDSRWEILDDDADVVQSLDRHVPSYTRGRARPTLICTAAEAHAIAEYGSPGRLRRK
jgi:hypothetical protein